MLIYPPNFWGERNALQPLLSIVTGTWNRLFYLSRMIDSAIAAIPPGLAWEIVVVDGGSTDGTLAWCRAQTGLRLIEHGSLRGAIPAFCDGARAASGKYVLLANDDITFEPDSILRAITHLELNPMCGAVAFEDDRPAPGYADGFKAQVISGVGRDGKPAALVYAQVGLFRRWLGNEAAWWGDKDPIMKQSRTYGGDNYLSARIWEMGYSVDVVAGCRVKDAVAPDALRDDNYKWEKDNGGAFHRRYPRGPAVGSIYVTPIPEIQQMRILYMPIYEPGYGKYKRGLKEALQRVGLVVEWDYLNEPRDFAALVSAWQPHLILTQFHDATNNAARQLEAARRQCPGAVVVNWGGDVWLDGLTSPAMIELLRHVDVQLTVNANVLETYAALGIQAAYWQIGYEPVSSLPAMPAHDVLFLGNAYSDERKALETALRGIRGLNIGIYGSGWQHSDGNTLYNFNAGAALYRRAKIAVSDNQYPEQRGFVSNRLFEALASGAFVLQQRIDGLEELTGLQDGVHYVAWDNHADLCDKIEYYLAHDMQRNDIAYAGEQTAHENHSFDARVRELFTVILPGVKHETVHMR